MSIVLQGSTSGSVTLQEPKKIAQSVKDLNLLHVVITSVDRDDLADGGAKHFADVISEIKKINTNTTVEVLTPDFLRKGDIDSKGIASRVPMDVYIRLLTKATSEKKMHLPLV